MLFQNWQFLTPIPRIRQHNLWTTPDINLNIQYEIKYLDFWTEHESSDHSDLVRGNNRVEDAPIYRNGSVA